ncbi:ATP-grasp domain-containing protein [Flavobacterium sp. MAH-1]|uniref:ATP-grasp domain-containing protein n=1 Tax=Flavobacterium agri TaxID=2743471 RepID=A0A7Y9C6F1_9FLAO|nr:ATP-grasp domain-containing protein [Flavobacterium agri]NUY80132.1 ATP-grasp domain-containing protein [Flavobacterium agri]NYA70157.1 ATP-grasp domain-containing protein [Flavobacterium agri]
MKKLAIIGASYLQLPLVLKASEMGIQTHCFAWPEGAVCKGKADFFYPISVLEKEQILEQCLEIGIDGICTIASDMPVPTISFVGEKMGLCVNSQKSAWLSTDKEAMRQAFDGKVQIPKFYKVQAPSDYRDALDFPIIVKPTDRSGSRGVTKLTNDEGLDQAIAYAISESFSKQAIIEEFISGREVSVESVSWQGKHRILAITDKITTGAPHFVELAHHEPSSFPSSILEKIEAETLKALDALEIAYGAAHSEFKITENGKVYAIEVGARMGGDFIGSHLVQLSTGYDYVKGVVEIALGEFHEPQFRDRAYSGVYFLSEETRNLIPYFERPNAFEVEKAVQNQELKNLKSSNDRSGYLIYQAAERIELP